MVPENIPCTFYTHDFSLIMCKTSNESGDSVIFRWIRRDYSRGVFQENVARPSSQASSGVTQQASQTHATAAKHSEAVFRLRKDAAGIMNWASLKGLSWPLFIYFRLFYKQFTVNNYSMKCAGDWIRTRVLWYPKHRTANCAITTADLS